MAQKRSIWYIDIRTHDQIKDGFLAAVPQENLEVLRSLYLVGLSLSEKGLEPLLKKLNSNFNELSIGSSRLTPQGVDAVIRALPRALGYLSIRGLVIGENAKEKFHQHAKEQEARTGLKLELDE